MPAWYRRRPLKRWCYVGAYGPECMLCAGVVRVGGMPQSFWAVWDGALCERTTVLRSAGVVVSPSAVTVPGRLALRVEPVGEVVEVVSDHGRGYIWTRKTPVIVSGLVGSAKISLPGLVDESAGYHARRTAWEWAAGVGTDTRGQPITWNLVRGVHDSPVQSERTVWVDGQASEVGPVTFSEALDEVSFASGSLAFRAVAERRRRDNLGLVASDYVQPFGVASGALPGGVELAAGYGVMERHRARW